MRKRGYTSSALLAIILAMVLLSSSISSAGAAGGYHSQEIFTAKIPPTTVAAGPPTQRVARGPGGGGALFAPSFSPHNTNELFISCDMSEVFHSTNLGATWDLYDFRQIQGNRESQIRFTSDPLIEYALDYTGDLVRPTKSTDGGVTWHRLSSDPTSG